MGKFNIRVYGLWIKNQKVLISHENIDGFKMTKFPGGGLEFGEGVVDCLKREFREELGVELVKLSLLHVSNRFIKSSFKNNEQVVAVHYLVQSNQEISNYNIVHPTGVGKLNSIQFVWSDINKELHDSLTFEMDKEALDSFNKWD
jgi:8-oxo-dGTP diphosphatase